MVSGCIVSLLSSPTTGASESGEEVFLRDIWPTRQEIQALEARSVIPAMFKQVYSKITKGELSEAGSAQVHSHADGIRGDMHDAIRSFTVLPVVQERSGPNLDQLNWS